MKKFLFVMFMAFPLTANAQTEHAGKAVQKKCDHAIENCIKSGQAAEHAGQAVKQECDPAIEGCTNHMQSKPAEHGGQPVKKKTSEHGGQPMN